MLPASLGEPVNYSKEILTAVGGGKVPDEPFSHIYVDLLGPIPSSHSCQYLFTIIDLFSRWPKAIPLSSTTASDCAQALLLHWVAQFGVHHHLTSHHGPQFTSALWTAVAASLGVLVYI